MARVPPAGLAHVLSRTRLGLATLAVAGFGFLGCAGGDDSSAASEASSGAPSLVTRPPVILISIDTLRSDRLPAYGYDRIETPAIDALRADSILFERAYTHMALTLPAHTSILSGQWPVDHAVRDNIGYRVSDQVPLLQNALRREGYGTYGAVSAFVLRATTGISRGFDQYDDGIQVTSGTDLGGLQRPGLETLERASAMLEQHRDERPDDPPFLFFHIYEPHTPNDPPEPFRSRYESAYDAEVAEADLVMGRLFEELRRLDLYDDALIILLSDHGEGLMDHGEYEHEVLLYREVIQVPLIVKLPGAERAGTRVSTPVQLVDVAPTVLDLLDLHPAGDPSGRGTSLFRLPAEPRQIFSESVYPRIHFGWSDLTSMVEGRFHFIGGPDPELYDLLEDPAERNNIIQSERAVARRLAAAVEAIDRELQPPEQVDAATKARMESLGYVGSTSGRAGPLPDPKSKISVLEDLGAAAAAFARGDDREAVRLYRAVVAEDPGMTYGWEQLGKAQRRAGNPEGAIEAYKQALAVSPTGSGPAALSLAEIFLDLGRIEEAREHAAIASPTQDAANDLLAQLALLEGDLAEARRLVEVAVARRSGRVEPLVTEVALLVREGRYEDALAKAAVAEREFGDRADVEALEGLAFERGRALAELRRLPEAAAAFREEIGRNPQEIAPYTFLAIALALDGDGGGASQALQDLVTTNPTPQAYAEAVRTLRALGDGTNAEALLQAARRRFPGAPELRVP